MLNSNGKETETSEYLKEKGIDTNLNNRRITSTYQVVTPESAEDGDYAEHGWNDEEGELIECDDWDIDENISLVDKAVSFLRNKGAHESSSSHFNIGCFYSTVDPDVNYTTGEETYYTYFLNNFTEKEEEEIFNKIHNK
jgi:hypothetical protein